jgi:uncharacterized membrane protein
VAASVVFAALPGDLDHKLMLVLRGVCAQRPDHSFIVEGQPLALEARMYGIFVGFALSVATAWIGGRWRRSELTRGWLAAVLVLFIAVMGVDGVNAVLADLRAPHLYPPRNELRLATGLLCGVGLAGFIAPVVSFVFWREREPTPFFAGWTELAASVGVSGLAGVVVLSGMPGSVLLSAMAVAAVFASFWLINSYVAVLAWSGIGAAAHWLDLAPELIVGFVLTVGELAALAALRAWLETLLGITWTI